MKTFTDRCRSPSASRLRPETPAKLARVADGVIVGSAIVKRMAAAAERGHDAADAALDFIRTMSAATREAR